MARLPIDQIQPGMVLSDPVVNREGTLLLGKGSRVSTDAIRLMKSWGIFTIAIEDGVAADAETTHPERDAVQNTIAEGLDRRFPDMPPHPLADEIKRVAARILTRRQPTRVPIDG
ncbi:MAG: hypothetical protein ACOWWM_04620 [Desulfobacterales bacterium]